MIKKGNYKLKILKIPRVGSGCPAAGGRTGPRHEPPTPQRPRCPSEAGHQPRQAVRGAAGRAARCGAAGRGARGCGARGAGLRGCGGTRGAASREQRGAASREGGGAARRRRAARQRAGRRRRRVERENRERAARFGNAELGAKICGVELDAVICGAEIFFCHVLPRERPRRRCSGLGQGPRRHDPWHRPPGSISAFKFSRVQL